MNPTIGQQIKFERCQKGLSQAALGLLIGCDDSTISRIEAGGQCLRLSLLQSISTALQVPLILRIDPGRARKARKRAPGSRQARRRVARK